ncbi:52 kDa repressor of the inhibitor of the protein kinase-like [Oopsacas minuta]|uniref:52 kDa repressor of the inhibitor of the protein kinase-like n=1 Tax=Oopsacas minuta TaxID=111878 RepID=A0AAV7K8R9_9METZ|nr:52 kDa repressor of the inhibitor of the protein kinase-like [Oopsacas minuta]
MISGEITDISNKEQLSLVLRYVDPENLLVREDLMSFLECDTTRITGRGLSNKILGCLNDYELDITKQGGQAYDGAGNVAGSIKGTAGLINTKYPLAFYLHCASHSLNHAVVKFLQVTSVHIMMGVVDRVSAKFYRRVSFQYER